MESVGKGIEEDYELDDDESGLVTCLTRIYFGQMTKKKAFMSQISLSRMVVSFGMKIQWTWQFLH